MPLLLLLAACDNQEAQTLQTCGTDVADDVPAFFSTYFRCVEATVDGDDVVLWTDDLPPHPSPYYETSHPNWVAFDDRGGDWFQNPNVLEAQDLTMRVPLEPTPRGVTITADLVDRAAMTSDEEYELAEVQGLAIDGTGLYSGLAGPGDDIREEKYTFDLYEGHPQQEGAYHHHSPTPGPLAVLAEAGLVTTTTPGEAEVELFGVMCDGTVVLGCTELDGSAPDSADLDAQLGHVHDVTDADGTTHFTERYHTHVCAAFSDDAFTPEIRYYECG